ncbi:MULTISPECIES: GNAT family N-acetyltransferase [unclassified Frankia]|uniref:GNAT family N-acetyltransferase n=1 Tax=unclassified Frankia TaxID=2632575 RepID=UPI001EE3BC80|nr:MULTISPECIES: GNAT family N-acetyltransferase [unclassified Frankia]
MSAVTDATRVRAHDDGRQQGGPAGRDDVLDNVIWTALTGRQAGFADQLDQLGRVARAGQFQPEVAPFAAMAGGPGAWAWDDLAAVVGPGGVATLFFVEDAPPAGWTVLDRIGLVQMVATADFADAPEPAARPLGPDDVPAMIELVERTKPGPFRSRTVELGSYLGVFEGNALVAMAGERLRVPGYTEISAVCTDPALRGQGLATRLMRAVAAGIRGRGETPFLHASALNVNAIRLYEHLGFVTRTVTNFQFVQAPALPEQRPAADDGPDYDDEDDPFVRRGECG